MDGVVVDGGGGVRMVNTGKVEEGEHGTINHVLALDSSSADGFEENADRVREDGIEEGRTREVLRIGVGGSTDTTVPASRAAGKQPRPTGDMVADGGAEH
jgi:hypothetical protein